MSSIFFSVEYYIMRTSTSINMKKMKKMIPYMLIVVMMMMFGIILILLCRMNKRKERAFLFETVDPEPVYTTPEDDTTTEVYTTPEDDTTTTTTTTTTSAPSTCDYTATPNTDFSINNDLRSLNGTLAECKTNCNDDPDCAGFQLTTDGTTCYLKGYDDTTLEMTPAGWNRVAYQKTCHAGGRSL